MIIIIIIILFVGLCWRWNAVETVCSDK